jgi:hypothetical protein
MHLNNRKWLEDLRTTYPKSFSNCSVLEIGSQDVNGSIRDYFTDCEYVGVDRVAGNGVDIVANATETQFSTKFDTIAMFSVFEHDLTWQETIKHNLQWLKDDGVMFICFGAEGNLPHMKIWQAVPHQEFLDYCASVGLRVLDAFFEEDRYGKGDSGVYNAVLTRA